MLVLVVGASPKMETQSAQPEGTGMMGERKILLMGDGGKSAKTSRPSHMGEKRGLWFAFSAELLTVTIFLTK